MKTAFIASFLAFLVGCGSSGGGSSPAPTPAPTPTPYYPPAPTATTSCTLGGHAFTLHSGIAFSGYEVYSGQTEIDTFNSNGTFVAYNPYVSVSGYLYGDWSLNGYNLTITWTPALNEGGVTVHHTYFTISQEYNCSEITWNATGQD